MTSRAAYYEDLLDLARVKRAEHSVKTTAFGLSQARAIYKREGVRVDYWPLPYKVKALYMCDEDDPSVALQRRLPDEPKLFAMIHELKHHYRDRELLGAGVIHCGDYDQNELIEKGAEVFAAEFIYPEAEFLDHIRAQGIGIWDPAAVVRFKRSCGAKVSYRFICKRLERVRLIGPGQFNGVRFQKLEVDMFGAPYRRRIAARARRIAGAHR